MATPVVAPPLDVLDAAMRAFAENGYHGATVRDVANRAGISVPGLYHHYASKQELLSALLETSTRVILDRSMSADAEAGSDPVERFRALIRTIVGFVAEHRELAVLQAEARYLEPDNWRRYVALRDEQQALVTSAIADGLAAGSFHVTAPPADTARALLAMCLGIATWYRPDGPMSVDDLASQYVELSLGLVGHR